MAVHRNIAALIIALLLVGGAGPVVAADWIVQSVDGSALVLDAEEWVALVPGEVLADPFTLRTLERAQVSVGTMDAAVSIKSKTTITVVSEPGLVSVELLQGGVSAFVQGDLKALLSAGSTQVDLAAGSAEIEMRAQGASVRSREGLVTVREPAEAPVLLAPGSTANRGGLSNDPPTSPIDAGSSGGGNGSGEAPANPGEGRGNPSGPTDAGGSGQSRP
jgi:hypothetical protein